MARNHQVVQRRTAESVPSTETETVTIDTDKMQRLTVFVQYSWEEVDDTTSGISIIQKYATEFGGEDILAENEDEIPDLPQPTLSASDEEHIWQWNIPLELVPRKIILEITNEDASGPMILDVWTDSGAL